MNDRFFFYVLLVLGCMALGVIGDYLKGEQDLQRARMAPAYSPDMAAAKAQP